MAMGGGMVLWMLLWGLVGIAVLALAVVGIVALSRKSFSDDPAVPARSDPAVEDLRHRLASGQIDEDEYLRRRAALE